MIKIVDVTYFFRRRYYRLRLFSRFMKHNYWGAWEMVEPMLEIPFEMFCEFYENGGIENICYDESPWKETKEEMDFLYNWYNEIMLQREEEIKTLLNEWCEHHVSWSIPLEDKPGWSLYQNFSTRYADYLSNMLHEEEQKFEKEKENALIRLMKIRNYLWT